jgi:predicted aldo/keto reductase-like oxidoreductase
MENSRRQFLGTAAAAITLPAWLEAAPDANTNMPMRNFGQTGKQVSALAFGCGSRFLAYKDEDQALAVLDKAFGHGIRYFDTAYDYGQGLSETRVGKGLSSRRNQIWLATKLPARKGDDALRILEGSLKRCQTDHFDLVHIHSLTTEEDLAAIEAKDGVLNMLYKMREQKVARNIGISCHTDPKVLKVALERHDFNCTQFALNAARIGQANVEGDSFEALALPVALRKKMGVVAMKIFAQDKLKGRGVTSQQLIRYSLSLPVGAVVIGMPQLEMLEENVATVKAFQPMTREDMRKLNEQLSGVKASIDRFFFDHLDA